MIQLTTIDIYRLKKGLYRAVDLARDKLLSIDHAHQVRSEWRTKRRLRMPQVVKDAMREQIEAGLPLKAIASQWGFKTPSGVLAALGHVRIKTLRGPKARPARLKQLKPPPAPNRDALRRRFERGQIIARLVRYGWDDEEIRALGVEGLMLLPAVRRAQKAGTDWTNLAFKPDDQAYIQTLKEMV